MSEIWFPSSERATATAIGAAIAPQLGLLVALGVSPIVTHNSLTDDVCNDTIYSSVDQQDIWRDFTYQRLFYYQLGVACLCIFTFMVTWLGEEGCNAMPIRTCISSLSLFLLQRRKLEMESYDQYFKNVDVDAML